MLKIMVIASFIVFACRHTATTPGDDEVKPQKVAESQKQHEDVFFELASDSNTVVNPNDLALVDVQIQVVDYEGYSTLKILATPDENTDYIEAFACQDFKKPETCSPSQKDPARFLSELEFPSAPTGRAQLAMRLCLEKKGCGKWLKRFYVLPEAQPKHPLKPILEKRYALQQGVRNTCLKISKEFEARSKNTQPPQLERLAENYTRLYTPQSCAEIMLSEPGRELLQAGGREFGTNSKVVLAMSVVGIAAGLSLMVPQLTKLQGHFTEAKTLAGQVEESARTITELGNRAEELSRTQIPAEFAENNQETIRRTHETHVESLRQLIEARETKLAELREVRSLQENYTKIQSDALALIPKGDQPNTFNFTSYDQSLLDAMQHVPDKNSEAFKKAITPLEKLANLTRQVNIAAVVENVQGELSAKNSAVLSELLNARENNLRFEELHARELTHLKQTRTTLATAHEKHTALIQRQKEHLTTFQRERENNIKKLGEMHGFWRSVLPGAGMILASAVLATIAATGELNLAENSSATMIQNLDNYVEELKNTIVDIDLETIKLYETSTKE